ncbi:MAG: type II secretion system GspH family protein [Armatimonadetes bacterium]|nr:type II secretion system GspH family protein [Armatimonadota bacterium]MDW8028434.1 prepilin-type N-terminal cleavage/methylation domain-containing protein [Armatimonadota bacterium]
MARTAMAMSLKGLTLTELLVVIAIIGALAGLIFARVQRGREKSRQIVFLSNLKQLGKAF